MRLISGLLALALVLGGCSSLGSSGHAEHSAQLGLVEPDPLGRMLYGNKHTMHASMLADLKTQAVFQGYTDEQIMRVMSLMGSDYTWPVSAPEVRGKAGVLVLAHGFGDHGDAVLRARLAGEAESRPVTLALGMSMMTSDHIQLGLNELAESGARDIVILPVVSTHTNSLMRQWEYIFDLSDEAEYARVPRVESNARLHFASPPDDHPLIGQILLDYAQEISAVPRNEEVIIVGHGPVDPADNREQLRLMENLAAMLRDGSEFAAVHVVSLQDDAPRDVRMARIRELRELVGQANMRGREVLVVTNLLGTRVVQSSLRRALRGLNYRFNPRGMIEHDNFSMWVDESVSAALR